MSQQVTPQNVLNKAVRVAAIGTHTEAKTMVPLLFVKLVLCPVSQPHSIRQHLVYTMAYHI